MTSIWDGIQEAFELILHWNPEIAGIAGLSLAVSGAATLLAAALMIPLTLLIYLRGGWLREWTTRLSYILMGVPSVIVGLLVVLVISGNGPLGALGLMYTPQAMVIAQFFLILPVVCALTMTIIRREGRSILRLAKTSGANNGQIIRLLIRELTPEMTATVMTAFSRAIAEVGTVMIVGGNIRHSTRVMTTAISMYTSMGHQSLSIALGIILFVMTLAINLVVLLIQGESQWK
ncbi:ABC transporter permease [Proteiniclasticum sp. QWL-01]|uniref:ABC transporter permease n=1 Tax=Proteiniclasticum sp. QWL-01 TaxID=3036945 RepID=UPI00220816C8|nr:ABC transporter permease [Proteiniclasticum sp. QWL-01]UUM13078.1 ABC transporter permease [Clostridiaceae bacterium HFYG-1003]WFF71501.1 ABC transporter permease [Proteiniclasticum sp. QWL-01]